MNPAGLAPYTSACCLQGTVKEPLEWAFRFLAASAAAAAAGGLSNGSMNGGGQSARPGASTNGVRVNDLKHHSQLQQHWPSCFAFHPACTDDDPEEPLMLLLAIQLPGGTSRWPVSRQRSTSLKMRFPCWPVLLPALAQVTSQRLP